MSSQAVLAGLALLLAAAAPGLLAQSPAAAADESAANQAPANRTPADRAPADTAPTDTREQDDATQTSPDTPAPAARGNSPFDYQPSEKISEDLPVSFPVDI